MRCRMGAVADDGDGDGGGNKGCSPFETLPVTPLYLDLLPGKGSVLNASGWDAMRNARRRFSPVSISVRCASRCLIISRIALPEA